MKSVHCSHRSHTSLSAALLTSPWGRSFFRDPDSTSRAITRTILRNFSFFFFSIKSPRYRETKHASMEIVVKFFFFFFSKEKRDRYSIKGFRASIRFHLFCFCSIFPFRNSMNNFNWGEEEIWINWFNI